MRSVLPSLTLALIIITLLGSHPAVAQVGAVTGTINDSSGAALPGARVDLEHGPSAVSDGQGQFTIPNVAAGTYTATVNYVGFARSTTTAQILQIEEA